MKNVKNIWFLNGFDIMFWSMPFLLKIRSDRQAQFPKAAENEVAWLRLLGLGERGLDCHGLTDGFLGLWPQGTGLNCLGEDCSFFLDSGKSKYAVKTSCQPLDSFHLHSTGLRGLVHGLYYSILFFSCLFPMDVHFENCQCAKKPPNPGLHDDTMPRGRVRFFDNPQRKHHKKEQACPGS